MNIHVQKKIEAEAGIRLDGSSIRNVMDLPEEFIREAQEFWQWVDARQNIWPEDTRAITFKRNHDGTIRLVMISYGSGEVYDLGGRRCIEINRLEWIKPLQLVIEEYEEDEEEY
mgnify:CR=1 FL=1